MTFSFSPVDLPEVDLERVDVKGYRHYRVGNNLYPSITSILDAKEDPNNSLEKWRQRVGEEEANRVSRHAANQGQVVHELVENHLLGNVVEKKYPPHILAHANRLKAVADKYIDNVRLIEGRLYSHKYRMAGTVDLVADFDGNISIVDWKTSKRKKERDWVHSYFMQESAYAKMFTEMTGIEIEKLVTIITTDCGGTQIFLESPRVWFPQFIDVRISFHDKHGT